MYGLPVGFTGSFFVGRAVERVSFASHATYIAFGNGLSLTVESAFEHQVNGEIGKVESQGSRIVQSRLSQLVGWRVESVDTDPQGTLSLQLDGGQSLRFFEDMPNFECYRIVYGQNRIVV